MRILAMHDKEGNISAIVVSPSDFQGRVGVMPELGHYIAEVDAAELISDDMTDKSALQRVLSLIEEFRVETKGVGKLVHKRPAKRRKK